MALMKVLRGSEQNLANQELHDGYIWYIKDTHYMYIDHLNDNGQLVRSKVSAEYADKLRYVEDGQTVEINPQDIALQSDVDGKLGKVLDSEDYGDVLPQATTPGRIFFTKFPAGSVALELGALPLTGGALSGDLTISRTNQEAKVNVENAAGSARLVVSNAGNKGIYDSSLNTWIIKSDPNGNIFIGTMGAITDCVVDQGKSGNWYYRKWSSGFAECWANITTAVNMTANAKYGVIGNIAYQFPFTFVETPVLTVNAAIPGNYTEIIYTTVVTNSGEVTVASTAASGSQNVTLRLSVQGKWK